ncbi:TIGR00730 family Rossman fold protein [Phytoactinopolyspora mesophila]|uniref:Cytokinin riboside 5'-monophosphate phosphoribohydrolase n=1 Tax=Phytoactinopolyspora mesophila TaxID=2650750 RepID=A0A7K3LYN3_9ACTN|nr:TIGR00730 family Rossman fold protein [Phytoactinopolyspora mesophila]
MRRVCVFCGSSPGNRAEYGTMAAKLGTQLATEGLGLVYGGARVGTMGTVSGAAIAAGGEVIGVIPQGLVDRELARQDLTELHVVGSMHERKALMNQLSDAFVVLAGGYGTFEELFEVVTWAQLGLHNKPIILLDQSGFFTPLMSMLDHAEAEGFISDTGRALVQHATDADEAIKLARLPAPPQPERFRLSPDET